MLLQPIYTVAVTLIILSSLGQAQTDGPADNSTKTILQKIKNRDFPSVFQAWNPADNLQGEDENTTIARHDLFFCVPEQLGLTWNNEFPGLADGFNSDSIEKAHQKRVDLLSRNPNILILAEIRYRDAQPAFLPENHAWFDKDESGKPKVGWSEGGHFILDFKNPDFRDQVAKQARAAVDSGVFDGVMLDWWLDDADRLELVKAVRKAVGPNSLILCNANDRKTPQTAPYINGYFMECTQSRTADDWQRIASTLEWAEQNLRKPTINCLETWYHQSRNDVALMRATTTLAMTLSDGYCLFSDPNPLPTGDHLHDWYPFWNTQAGKPTAKGKKDANGCYIRSYEKGIAVYCPLGNKPAVLTFPNPVRSAATGKTGTEHTVESGDGDIFLNHTDPE